MSYLKSRIEADKAELEELERKLVAGNIKGVEREVKDPTAEYGYRTIRFKAVRTSPEIHVLSAASAMSVPHPKVQAAAHGFSILIEPISFKVAME